MFKPYGHLVGYLHRWKTSDTMKWTERLNRFLWKWTLKRCFRRMEEDSYTFYKVNRDHPLRCRFLKLMEEYQKTIDEL
jgi:hypothetical protein